jgi:hypothetical protein
LIVGNREQAPAAVRYYPEEPPSHAPALASAVLPGDNRWAGSAYAFIRRGAGVQLAAGGTLGGSQIGARITYRLNEARERPVALSARFYAPTNDIDATEIAGGLEWKPFASLPVRLLAERRQAIAGEGRSAFSLLAHGGVSGVAITGPLRLDAYGQAGVVGARSRDLFADGALRVAAPLDVRGTLSVGAGIWAAAQPGVERVDLGPTASVRVGEKLRLTGDWRFRIGGDASPRSGPALTLSSDF